MRSRTVQPIKRQGKKAGRRKNNTHNFGDTQPMAPVRPDRFRDGTEGGRIARPTGLRTGYREYQKVIDRRREVLRAPKPAPDKGSARRTKPERRGTSGGALRRALGKSVAKGQYFDFDIIHFSVHQFFSGKDHCPYIIAGSDSPGISDPEFPFFFQDFRAVPADALIKFGDLIAYIYGFSGNIQLLIL